MSVIIARGRRGSVTTVVRKILVMAPRRQRPRRSPGPVPGSAICKKHNDGKEEGRKEVLTSRVVVAGRSVERRHALAEVRTDTAASVGALRTTYSCHSQHAPTSTINKASIYDRFTSPTPRNRRVSSPVLSSNRVYLLRYSTEVDVLVSTIYRIYF